jgi:hypothetical protein
MLPQYHNYPSTVTFKAPETEQIGKKSPIKIPLKDKNTEQGKKWQ